MSNTDTTTNANAASTTTTAAPDFLQQLLSNLSAEGQAVVAFFDSVGQSTATVLAKIASGGAMLVADIETLCEDINSKLGIINSMAGTISQGMASLPPSDATTDLQKLVSAVQQGLNDAAQVSTSLSSGSTVGDSTTVTTATSVLKDTNDLLSVVAQASALLAKATGAAPSATQAVSPPSPPQG